MKTNLKVKIETSPLLLNLGAIGRDRKYMYNFQR